MEPSAETAARAVRDRLLVEPTHWFVPPDDTPALAGVATAVWEPREARLVYRGTDVVVQPLGVILKGDKWYLLGLARSGVDRLGSFDCHASMPSSSSIIVSIGHPASISLRRGRHVAGPSSTRSPSTS